MASALESPRRTFAWRILYFGGFVLGGFLTNSLPWFQWGYGELVKALGSESFRAVTGSWPLGLLLIALLFRRPIAGRIRAMTEFAVAGAKAQFAPQQDKLPELPSALGIPPGEEGGRHALVEAVPARAAAEAHPPAVVQGAGEIKVNTILVATHDDYVIRRENEIREGLAQAAILDPPEQAVPVLARLAGMWMAVAEFENLYGYLWGGQVTLLRDMLAGPISIEQATAFFEAWQERNKLKQPDNLDRWIRFLGSVDLLGRQGNELHLTIKGRSFLRFLHLFNRPDPTVFR